MTRYAPGSQSHEVMQAKEQEAMRLLAQGLSVAQIALQLRCSTHFVRRVRRAMVKGEK